MRLLLLAVVVCCAAVALAKPPVHVAHYEPVEKFTVSEDRDQLSFYAYNHKWTFQIWLTDVRSENKYHFFGRLAGPHKSIASFTLLPNYITGLIVFNNETFWLEAKDPATPLDLFLYKSSDITFDPAFAQLKCGHSGHTPVHQNHGHNKRVITSYAVFEDQYWVSNGYNPSWYTADGTYGLLNDVNVLYAASGLSTFNFAIEGVRSNSWITFDTLSYMLNDLATFWSGNAHDGKNALWLVGNNVGGLAYLGTGCSSNPFYKTAVAGLSNWSRLWTVKTIAHELGHNRGANHDFNNQCGQGQGSGCQCSVMSYCFPDASTAGGAVNYFSQTSINEIWGTCN